MIWKNEKRKLSELKPAAYNPRKISKKQKEDLSDSMKMERIMCHENKRTSVFK